MNSSLRWIKMLILTRGGLPLVNPLQLCALITMQLSIAVDQLESVGFDGVITKEPTFLGVHSEFTSLSSCLEVMVKR